MQELVGDLRSIWFLWLTVLFLGIVFWTLRPKNKGLEAHGAIPLRDDDEKER